MVQVDLVKIVIRDGSEHQFIFLRERDGSREFSIVIGEFEAKAISRKVNEKVTARPMTHDLMFSLVSELEAQVERVVVTRLENSTYFAELCIERKNSESFSVDCRPSDAIALAVRTGCPIYVAKEVLRHACPDKVASDLDP